MIYGNLMLQKMNISKYNDMNKSDKEDYYFKSKIHNIIETVEKKNYSKFSYFLDEHQICMAKNILTELNCKNHIFYGKNKNLNRLMLCVYPCYLQEQDIQWPINILRFKFNKNYKLHHKDFLGSLMSLQIKRELIGDIKISEGLAEILIHQNCCEFILNNLTKVGSVGIKIDVVNDFSIDTEIKFSEISGTIASFRIDNIVALLTKLSRSKAVELIKASKVSVNYKEILDASYIVNYNDTITIRGFGKYTLTNNIKKTKKERYYVVIKKYV